MLTMSIPDPKIREIIEIAARADSSLCMTCGSCDSGCPVNLATGRLRPQRIVRLANMGFLEELLSGPDIWYCQICRQCLQACPSAVKPCVLIEYLRMTAVSCGLVTRNRLQRYRELFTRFQRVRWHAATACMQGEMTKITDKQWHKWLQTPADASAGWIAQSDMLRGFEQLRAEFDTSRLSACFTCGECSSACPVSGGPSVFDPRTLFRMVNLGLVEDLMQSPSIWLCVSCGRCTEACSQLVDGRQLISRLQELAVETGAVDMEFRLRLEQANKVIYGRFLDEIDTLFDPDQDIVETYRTSGKSLRISAECACTSPPV